MGAGQLSAPSRRSRGRSAARSAGLRAIGWRPDIEAEPVVVAVIDSGVDYTHPDLADKFGGIYRVPRDFGVDDDNGYVDDVVGWDFTDAPGLPG